MRLIAFLTYKKFSAHNTDKLNYVKYIYEINERMDNQRFKNRLA